MRLRCLFLSMAYIASLLLVLATANIENPFIQTPLICIGIGCGWWAIRKIWGVTDGEDS